MPNNQSNNCFGSVNNPLLKVSFDVLTTDIRLTIQRSNEKNKGLRRGNVHSSIYCLCHQFAHSKEKRFFKYFKFKSCIFTTFCRKHYSKTCIKTFQTKQHKSLWISPCLLPNFCSQSLLDMQCKIKV